MDTEEMDRLRAVYEDLHSHPELSFQEHHTAVVVTQWLADLGYEVLTGIARTGVVGVLANGPGPTALVRADMDALPVRRRTGFPMPASAGTDRDGYDVPVMHACGHDMHVDLPARSGCANWPPPVARGRAR